MNIFPEFKFIRALLQDILSRNIFRLCVLQTLDLAGENKRRYTAQIISDARIINVYFRTN